MAGPLTLALPTFISLQQPVIGGLAAARQHSSGASLPPAQRRAPQLGFGQHHEQVERAQWLRSGFEILIVVHMRSKITVINESLEVVVRGQDLAQLNVVDMYHRKRCSSLPRAYSSGF